MAVMVWVRCPRCKTKWHAATVEVQQIVTVVTQAVCPSCGQRPPMLLAKTVQNPHAGGEVS